MKDDLGRMEGKTERLKGLRDEGTKRRVEKQVAAQLDCRLMIDECTATPPRRNLRTEIINLQSQVVFVNKNIKDKIRLACFMKII